MPQRGSKASTSSLSGRPVLRIPGHDVDRIDVKAGLRELTLCGYDDPHTVMVIEYALMRWARGEEEQAQKGAINASFHGVNLTSWIRVLAAARGSGEWNASLERRGGVPKVKRKRG